MRPDIKKNVFHLCWSPEKNSVHEVSLYTYIDIEIVKCAISLTNMIYVKFYLIFKHALTLIVNDLFPYFTNSIL